MRTRRPHLPLYLLGSVTAIVALFVACLVCGGRSFSGQAVWLFPCAMGASLLVLAFTAFLLHRRIQHDERTELKFRCLLEAAPEAIIITRPDGRILLVNEQAEKLFGYDRTEWLGQGLESVLRQVEQPADGHRPSKPGGTSTGSGGAAPAFLGRRKDGTEIAVEVSFSPLKTKEGLLILNLIKDITERQKRDKRRRARHAVRGLLAGAVSLPEAAPAVLQAISDNLVWELARLWVVDESGKALRQTATWEATSRPSDSLPDPAREEVPCLDSEFVNRVWQEGEPTWTKTDRDGVRQVLGIPVLFNDEVFGVIELFGPEGKVHDESELETLSIIAAQVGQFLHRKKAEEALQQSEERFRQVQKMEAVGRLAGGVAHDFNNLLTVILNCGHLLLDKFAGDDQSRQYVQEINKAGERAAALTRQLLAFSRKQILAPQVLDLNAVVSDTSKMLRRLIGEDIQLASVLADDLQPVKADPSQLAQVLLNLVVNARDAMPAGGKLTLETANIELDETYTRDFPELRPGPHVLLAVRDTGCGMTEEVKARLFEPFFTTKEVDKGTGLGLATVYGIVRQSGGHITVQTQPGRGTTFKVYLPAAAQEFSKPNPTPTCPVPVRGSETILLVEDEERVRQITRKVLESNGYTVCEARDGAEALRLFDRRRDTFDLVMTDMVMPGMSGAELVQRLRRRRPHLPVLFVSGYTDNEMFRLGLVDADESFLQKPFTPADLARQVREILDASPVITGVVEEDAGPEVAECLAAV
jgi:PAS domain S-box-containing protein